MLGWLASVAASYWPVLVLAAALGIATGWMRADAEVRDDRPH